MEQQLSELKLVLAQPDMQGLVDDEFSQVSPFVVLIVPPGPPLRARPLSLSLSLALFLWAGRGPYMLTRVLSGAFHIARLCTYPNRLCEPGLQALADTPSA